MMTQYTRQETSTYYSQTSSTTGYCGYNSYVYPPHEQKLHQTASTNVRLSSSTNCSYSALIITARALPLTTTPTLCTVLPPFNQFFCYPKYSLPPTADTTNSCYMLRNLLHHLLASIIILSTKEQLLTLGLLFGQNNYPNVLKREEVAVKLKLEE